MFFNSGIAIHINAIKDQASKLYYGFAKVETTPAAAVPTPPMPLAFDIRKVPRDQLRSKISEFYVLMRPHLGFRSEFRPQLNPSGPFADPLRESKKSHTDAMKYEPQHISRILRGDPPVLRHARMPEEEETRLGKSSFSSPWRPRNRGGAEEPVHAQTLTETEEMPVEPSGGQRHQTFSDRSRTMSGRLMRAKGKSLMQARAPPLTQVLGGTAARFVVVAASGWSLSDIMTGRAEQEVREARQSAVKRLASGEFPASQSSFPERPDFQAFQDALETDQSRELSERNVDGPEMDRSDTPAPWDREIARGNMENDHLADEVIGAEEMDWSPPLFDQMDQKLSPPDSSTLRVHHLNSDSGEMEVDQESRRWDPGLPSPPMSPSINSDAASFRTDVEANTPLESHDTLVLPKHVVAHNGVEHRLPEDSDTDMIANSPPLVTLPEPLDVLSLRRQVTHLLRVPPRQYRAETVILTLKEGIRVLTSANKLEGWERLALLKHVMGLSIGMRRPLGSDFEHLTQ
ncbi:hypothetical protein M427DRAFT_167038 [Gonapodya prolifera JEL478]|uniref:Uncharacterized protein n=1 Tax=Gonapodya prolifera (strain JEL478) TaxID=1344416 RepID=A0A139AZR9_GONPJ|nr:hypothetical protein M427DRAFT_167038 [Gonapodya prolifera JEL478]|eukprot:KXS22204.1 hypothetical protein M427DRAFT_167038 [Gonapodya prolifera JEL478]